MCTSAKARGDCAKRRGYECRGTRCVRSSSRRVGSNSKRTTTKK